mmetsp:Transcript_72411/g.172572  ORF Transcript_72411/g.172572 Transcript_72411/m.172572 type:complete len:723 (+) Transcript_72411:107-2275(+)
MAGLLSSVSKALNDGVQAAQPKLNAALEAASPKINAAMEAAQPKINAAMEAAQPAVAFARNSRTMQTFSDAFSSATSSNASKGAANAATGQPPTQAAAPSAPGPAYMSASPYPQQPTACVGGATQPVYTAGAVYQQQSSPVAGTTTTASRVPARTLQPTGGTTSVYSGTAIPQAQPYAHYPEACAPPVSTIPAPPSVTRIISEPVAQPPGGSQGSYASSSGSCGGTNYTIAGAPGTTMRQAAPLDATEVQGPCQGNEAPSNSSTWKSMQDMGIGKMELAAALDSCTGYADKAMKLLSSGWRPSTLGNLPSLGSIGSRQNNNSKPCSICSAASTLPGLCCMASEAHRVCDKCLLQHVKSAIADTSRTSPGICCPVAGCSGGPWPFTAIAQRIPEDLFVQLLQSGDRHREHQLKQQLEQTYQQREQKLQGELASHREELAKVRTSPLSAPSYWSEAPVPPARFKVVPASVQEMSSLVQMLTPGGTLGGRDTRQCNKPYTTFRFAGGWRVENPALYGKYAAERHRLSTSVHSLRTAGRPPRDPRLRSTIADAAKRLPCDLDAEANEVLLLHGTSPEVVLNIMAGGFNERYSGIHTHFGLGNYFAEDAAKSDQYVTEDERQGAFPDLHNHLYTSTVHPGSVFYIFVCRAVLGHLCRTKDAKTDLDSGATLWSSHLRELSIIPGSSPSEPHHALLAEVGGAVMRFREFILFHGDRVYPEYLIAYQRV